MNKENILKEENNITAQTKQPEDKSNSGRVFSYVPFSIDGLTLINGDCRTVLDSFAPKTFDLIVTSPPFNVGIDYGEGREADKKKFR